MELDPNTVVVLARIADALEMMGEAQESANRRAYYEHLVEYGDSDCKCEYHNDEGDEY